MRIEALINEIEQGEDFTDAHQEAALTWVAELGRLVADDGGRPSLPDGAHLQCALLASMAALHGRPDVIIAMANSPVETVRASLAAVDIDGGTPLHKAAECGHEHVFIALLNSANPAVLACLAARDVAGNTPAHVAALAGSAGVVQALVSSPDPGVQASLTAPNQVGATPAHYAAHTGSAGVVNAVARSPDEAVRASLASPGPGGSTPLHVAARRGHENAVIALLNSGHPAVLAGLTALNDAGQTPANLASAAGRVGLAETLDPANLALAKAAADLAADGSTEAKGLVADLECPVLMTVYTAAGPRRPVRLLNPGHEGSVGAPMQQCLSAAAAEGVDVPPDALHPLSPFNRQPFDGYAEASDRVQLLNLVAQAYHHHGADLPSARAQALQAHADHEAALRNPDAAATAGRAAPPHYLEVLARPVAAQGAGVGAGGPQAG